jgi:hypothetical protein
VNTANINPTVGPYIIVGIFEDAPLVDNIELSSIKESAITNVIIAAITQEAIEAYPAILALYSAVKSQLEPISDVIPTPTKPIKVIFYSKQNLF